MSSIKSDKGIQDETDRLGHPGSCDEGPYSDTEMYDHDNKNKSRKRLHRALFRASSAEAKGPSVPAQAEENIKEAGDVTGASASSTRVDGGADPVCSFRDVVNRQRKTYTERPQPKTYKNVFKNEPGKRFISAGAQAGVGGRGAHWGVFSAEAKGPNASAGVKLNCLGPGAKARAELGSASASAGPVTATVGLGGDAAQGIVDIIDNFDRPGEAYAEGTYSGTGTYAHAGENETGKRIPKAGAFAEAGVGRARAHWRIFSAEAKGPNASAGAQANILGAGAMARAELASASASAGPVSLRVGLGLDTGVRVGPGSAELKFLGCGVTVGETVGISVFGSECKLF